jgi:hypothetical protein
MSRQITHKEYAVIIDKFGTANKHILFDYPDQYVLTNTTTTKKKAVAPPSQITHTTNTQTGSNYNGSSGLGGIIQLNLLIDINKIEPPEHIAPDIIQFPQCQHDPIRIRKYNNAIVVIFILEGDKAESKHFVWVPIYRSGIIEPQVKNIELLTDLQKVMLYSFAYELKTHFDMIDEYAAAFD